MCANYMNNTVYIKVCFAFLVIYLQLFVCCRLQGLLYYLYLAINTCTIYLLFYS